MEKIKLLICDDHTLFRHGIKASLSMYSDIEVIGEASDGSQLLMSLEHLKPNVILLDINMPIKDGIETLPLIKEAYPNVGVIVISMHNQTSMISKMIGLGADSYLTKGDDSSTIYEAVKTVYGGNPYFTPLVARALFKAAKESNDIKNKEVKIYSNFEYDEQDKPKNVETPIIVETIPSLPNEDKDSHLEKRIEELEKTIVTELKKISETKETNDSGIGFEKPDGWDEKDEQNNWSPLIKKILLITAITVLLLASIWLVVRVRNMPAFEFKTELMTPKGNTIESSYGYR